ncbi:MAG TPA: ligase-associated DNA damage response endonuclease PdeM [Alphaproteobacteria bacterium]|nr:ligase-associated DNA damage response endonuclease PdeM [Alphaproteobacteria bacterium]
MGLTEMRRPVEMLASRDGKLREVCVAATTMLNGAELVLDPSGALWWPEQSTLAVADLHLAKGSALAGRSKLLRPGETRATIERLAVVLRRYRPRRVVVLGDGFHERHARSRLNLVDGERLAGLIGEHEWVWVAGAHPGDAPAPLGGRTVAELDLDGLVFRCEPGELGDGEVCGGFHPKAAIRVRGRRISGRCFVTDGLRLILPAFGAYTGGLDARDPMIAELFGDAVRVYLIGRNAIYLFPVDRLEPARRIEDVALARQSAP